MSFYSKCSDRLGSRRRFLKLLGAGLLGHSLSGCQPEKKPITFAANNWPGYEPLYLAQTLGWLNNDLVRLTETVSTSHSLMLLKQGAVDGAALTLGEVLEAKTAGIELSIVMVCDISSGADMVLVRPEITQLNELSGKHWVYDGGALGILMLHSVLQLMGITEQDITLTQVTTEAHDLIWERLQPDAIITYEPYASHMIQTGAYPLFTSRQIPDTIFDVYAVRTDLLNQSRLAMTHLITSHQQALSYMHRYSDDFAYRMAPHLKLKANQVFNLFNGLVMTDLTNNYRLLYGQEPLLLKQALNIAALLLKTGHLKSLPDMSTLICADYLPNTLPTT